MSETQDKPSIAYWHLYADEDGVSRQRQCLMTAFDLKSIASGAAPQWQGEKHHDGMTVMMSVLPVGWLGDWHENPAPQWIVPLSGTWFVEAMDGTRAEMGPGQLAFGEDQGCRTVDGKTGHTSGTVGSEPAVLMIVQFDSKRDRTTPCRFG